MLNFYQNSCCYSHNIVRLVDNYAYTRSKKRSLTLMEMGILLFSEKELKKVIEKGINNTWWATKATSMS
jgi:hypothetical protein